MGHAFYPEAELAPSAKLKKGLKTGTDVLVVLRRDLLDNPQVMARLNNDAPPAASISQAPPDTGKLTAAKAEAEASAAIHQEPQGVNQAKSGEQQPLASQSKEVAAQPLTSPEATPLTFAERVDTAIEISNGNGTKDLARQTRSLLRQEGFTVASIGNHVDFGAAETVIYYRPEAEKVARAVGATVFPRAGLEPSLQLKEGMDIKILLGADLRQRPQLMARMIGGGN